MMKSVAAILTVALAASGTVASSWFPGTKPVYNKWHQSELERWLSDHDIPYPTPADRADLEARIDKRWNDLVVEPYLNWDAAQLNSFIRARGKDTAVEAQETKDSLISRARANWYETEDNSRQAWANIRTWVFDTWTDSQLKAFCDKHGIPVPQPRHRDTLLQKARLGYEAAAKKAGETIAYPGNWLYSTWSESDLKSWLDTNGFPAPQPSIRDKLVASVRRNSRLAYLKAQSEITSANADAHAAYSTLTNMLIDAWGESQLKEFCDKNGIPIPQGTRLNELRALVCKHRAKILGDTVSATASSAFGAATSNIGSEFAKASDSASSMTQSGFDRAIETWSESRLKAFLDARSVPIPQLSNVNELRALVRKHSHKASTGWSAWTYDDMSSENLKQYLAKHGNEAAKAAAAQKDASRDELVSAAHSAYSSASSAGGAGFASVTSAIASVTAAVKQGAFETWSDSDLKYYLYSYGIAVPQGSTLEELKALARRQSTYFSYGTSSPGETIFAKFGETARQGWSWVAHQLKLGSQAAQQKTAQAGEDAKHMAEKAREEL